MEQDQLWVELLRLSDGYMGVHYYVIFVCFKLEQKYFLKGGNKSYKRMICAS